MAGFEVIDSANKTLGIPVAPQTTNVTATVGATVTDIRGRTSQTNSNINTTVVASGVNNTPEEQQAAIQANSRAVATAIVGSIAGEEASSRVINIAQVLSANPEIAAGTDIGMLTQPLLTEAEAAVQQAEAAAATVVGEKEKAIANAKTTEARSMLEQAKEEVSKARGTSSTAVQDVKSATDSFTQSAQGAASGKTPAQQVAEKSLGVGGSGKSGGLSAGAIAGIAGGSLVGLGALGAIPGVPSLSIPGLGGINIDKMLSSIKIPSIDLPGLSSVPNPLSLIKGAVTAGAAALKALMTFDVSSLVSAALSVLPPFPRIPKLPTPPIPAVPPIALGIPNVVIELTNLIIALPTTIFYGISSAITALIGDSSEDLESATKAAQDEALVTADETNAAATEQAVATQAETAAQASEAQAATTSATPRVDAATQQAVNNAAEARGPMDGTVTAVGRSGNVTMVQPPTGGPQIT